MMMMTLNSTKNNDCIVIVSVPARSFVCLFFWLIPATKVDAKSLRRDEGWGGFFTYLRLTVCGGVAGDTRIGLTHMH